MQLSWCFTGVISCFLEMYSSLDFSLTGCRQTVQYKYSSKLWPTDPENLSLFHLFHYKTNTKRSYSLANIPVAVVERECECFTILLPCQYASIAYTTCCT